ncbi:MAG TPA: alpha/beta hydrolase [Enteractinococcus sp.]
MALDAPTLKLLEQRAASAVPPLWEMTPAQARQLQSNARQLPKRQRPMHEIHDHRIAASLDGNFRLRVFQPTPHPTGVFVYYHGGGWVLGDLEQFDTLARAIADETNCTVVLPEYRLAPEFPFPTAVEDAWDALTWTVRHLPQLANTPSSLYIAGDSAGGTLATVIAHRSHERMLYPITRQFLLYPATSADFSYPSYHEPANQTLLPWQAMKWFWDHYLPEVGQRCHPDASPMHIDRLEQSPPATIITAAHDILRDEGNAYAAKLQAAGVEVSHQVWPGQMHGFSNFVDVLPASGEVLALIARQIAPHAVLKHTH